MPSSAATLSVRNLSTCNTDSANLWNSETALPYHHQVQEHAAGGRADQGHGPSVDVEHQLVLPVHLRSPVCLRLPPRQ